jgi:hypothetical protein
MVDLQIVEPKTEGISGSESLRGKSSKKTKKKSFEQSLIGQRLDLWCILQLQFHIDTIRSANGFGLPNAAYKHHHINQHTFNP